MRDLDLSCLRSLTTIADAGTMSRAAKRLHRSPGAISMQIKRLEDALGAEVFHRRGGSLVLSPTGEQLLHYAREMLALNDEAWGRLAEGQLDGEVRLGVPSDLIEGWVPQALRLFARAYPRARVALHTATSGALLAGREEGLLDLTLTTEEEPGAAAEQLDRQPLVWVGAPGGEAWRRRPLPLALCPDCAFKPACLAALAAARIDWRPAIETTDDRAIDAVVRADLCVSVSMAELLSPGLAALAHGGQLPPLPHYSVALYRHPGGLNAVGEKLADYLRGGRATAAVQHTGA